MKDAEPQSEIKRHLLPTVPINDSQLQKGHLFLSYKGSGLLYGEWERKGAEGLTTFKKETDC